MFHCVLVLDEADRILDLGFAECVNAIIENLPKDRQTLLFSATQTRSVKDLARLSLKDPEYVSVHEHEQYSTPLKLQQNYLICELHEKIDILFSFLKNHIKSKLLIFVSSCKQVKYLYEALRHLKPGLPLMALYGRQKQVKRMAIYEQFCRKTSAALLATDIAARGLDFPAVHWVIQMDCPEDGNTYIHRVGRTARFEKDGQALIFLMPSEKDGMLKSLDEKKIPISEIRVNPKRMTSIKQKLASLCAQNSDLKHWAQRAFITYLRSVFLQSNKDVFDVSKLPVNEFAVSLGLPTTPRIRFLQKAGKLRGPATTVTDDSQHKGFTSDKSSTADVFKSGSIDEDEDENENELLRVKRRDVSLEDATSDLTSARNDKPRMRKKDSSRVQQAKTLQRKKIKLNSKILFDEDGEPILPVEQSGKDLRRTRELGADSDMVNDFVDITPVPLEEADGMETGGINLHKVTKSMRQIDVSDKDEYRKLIKAKHKEVRLKRKRQRIVQDAQDHSNVVK
jgi:ATP-dependent RNA helicase DDX10/DBP4